MPETEQKHFRLKTMNRRDNELLVNGVPISRLAERAGGTPFYAYDREAITARVAELRNNLPARIKLHYAIKANPMPAVVQHLAPLVDGFDVASRSEMHVALNAGMRPAQVSFAGPGKTPAELRSAIAAEICINAESELELQRIEESADALGLEARVALRVNPDFELKGSGMKMSGSPRQFGIDAERIPGAIKLVSGYGLKLEGLHIFCGSQNLNAESIIDANRQTLALAAELAAHAPDGFRSINIGGGYGIPYFPRDVALDVPAVGNGLAEVLEKYQSRLGDAEIIVELGRYLVGEAGYYTASVTDIKLSKGHTFLIVDGGLHHHLANSGNFGQVLRKNYPVVIGNKIAEPPGEPVTVVGPLCTPLDIVAENIALPEAGIGDLVVVFQSGAYGYSASPQDFLSHPRPLEILV